VVAAVEIMLYKSRGLGYGCYMLTWETENLQNFKKLLEFGCGNVPKRPHAVHSSKGFLFFWSRESEGLDEMV